MNTSYNIQQYQRQVILPGIGNDGQQKLHEAKVLVIGAGGLGCPALLYLVAAGIGHIGIADGDIVDLSNLHRQVLYSVADIGKNKASVAAKKLQLQNPDCGISIYDCFIDKQNAFDIIAPYDIVLDGSDNFSTRYLINDVCVLLNKPLIYGAVYRFEGQVAVFNVTVTGNNTSAQYRDLFPEPAINIQNCAEAGVLGVLPGIIGCMQAAEVIKLITGVGKPLVNQLLTFNALNNQAYTLEITPTKEGFDAVPNSKEALLQSNYDIDVCVTSDNIEIDSFRFDALLNEGFVAVDVREVHEQPNTSDFTYLKMPLSSFNADRIQADRLMLFCQSGVRSKIAANTIIEKFPGKKVYSLKGGIIEWLNNHIAHIADGT